MAGAKRSKDEPASQLIKRTLIALLASSLAFGDGISISNWPVVQPVSGTVGVSNFPASQAVTGTFWQATQPVSGTFWQATQPVSIASMPSTPVTGTFWQATQPISGNVGQSGTWTVQPGNTANTTPWLTVNTPNTLVISSAGAAGVGVTATLPNVASQFHYINMVEIVAYSTGTATGSATPITVTTTNLPGSLAFTFETARTIGGAFRRDYQLAYPIRSSVVNTNTTIVCPATVGVIWRVNVFYFTAV